MALRVIALRSIVFIWELFNEPLLTPDRKTEEGLSLVQHQSPVNKGLVQS